MIGGNSYEAVFYPQIARIHLDNTTIDDFKMFGKKKFFVYNSFLSHYLASEASMLYFDREDDEETSG